VTRPQGPTFEPGAHTRLSLSGPTGVLYDNPSAEGLIEAIQQFIRHRTAFDPDVIRAHVEPFDRMHFKQRMQEVIRLRFEDFRRVHPC
jgi:hypothetical protein